MQQPHDNAASAADTTDNAEELHRGLSNRHIQLIAIGGAIGTGLFMGSGKAISKAGPSILLVYMVIGAAIFLVLRAMGEILLSNLKYKSFSDFATDLIGRPAGFSSGGRTGSCGWSPRLQILSRSWAIPSCGGPIYQKRFQHSS